MALGSSVPDTPEAFVQSVRRQTGHVVFQQQSFIECIARFEVKKKHSFSHSKTFHLRDVALINYPFFFVGFIHFIHFFLESPSHVFH